MPEDDIKSQNTQLPEDDFGFGPAVTPQAEIVPEDDFGFGSPQDPDNIKLSPDGERIKEAADQEKD